MITEKILRALHEESNRTEAAFEKANLASKEAGLAYVKQNYNIAQGTVIENQYGDRATVTSFTMFYRQSPPGVVFSGFLHRNPEVQCIKLCNLDSLERGLFRVSRVES